MDKYKMEHLNISPKLYYYLEYIGLIRNDILYVGECIYLLHEKCLLYNGRDTSIPRTICLLNHYSAYIDETLS